MIVGGDYRFGGVVLACNDYQTFFANVSGPMHGKCLRNQLVFHIIQCTTCLQKYNVFLSNML